MSICVSYPRSDLIYSSKNTEKVLDFFISIWFSGNWMSTRGIPPRFHLAKTGAHTRRKERERNTGEKRNLNLSVKRKWRFHRKLPAEKNKLSVIPDSPCLFRSDWSHIDLALPVSWILLFKSCPRQQHCSPLVLIFDLAAIPSPNFSMKNNCNNAVAFIQYSDPFTNSLKARFLAYVRFVYISTWKCFCKP